MIMSVGKSSVKMSVYERTDVEEKRIQIMNGVIGGELRVGEAAEIMGMSERMRGDYWQRT